jgi:hypothetical protein
MDARRKQIYACIYSRGTGPCAPTDMSCGLKRKTDYLLTNIDSFLDRVQGRTLFVGDGVPLWRDVIKEKYAAAAKKGAKCQAVFASEKDAHPQARNLSHLAFGRFEKKVYDDVETLVPLYLYTQDCQVDVSKK